LAISSWAFRGLATKDGGTFEDVEFFSRWLRLYLCAGSFRCASGVLIYDLPRFAFSSFQLLCHLPLGLCRSSFQQWVFRQRGRSGAGEEDRALVFSREWDKARGGKPRLYRRIEVGLELESAGSDGAWREIGGGAAATGVPAKDGNAGTARGCGCKFAPICVVLHTPTQAELGWGTRCSFGIYNLGAAGAGSAGFRCNGRRRAGLQLGFGAGHFGGHRSGGR